MAKVIVILGFALAFAAGLVIGSRRAIVEHVPASEVPTTSPSERRGPGGWLQEQLGLTSDQRQQLDKIWSEIARRGRSEHEDIRREFRRERDAAIADLVPPAALGEYDAIINHYSERVAGLERESRETYNAAVEKTKSILTPAQRVNYEELLRRHKWGSSGAARDRHTTRRSETRATSQPDRPDSNSPSHETLKGAR
jgi:Spy/CpxP family protein refolding chaperone